MTSFFIITNDSFMAIVRVVYSYQNALRFWYSHLRVTSFMNDPKVGNESEVNLVFDFLTGTGGAVYFCWPPSPHR